MTVLVTGGAGYIGSHLVRLLVARGERVVVIDDLVSGNAARIPMADLIRIDLASDSATKSIERAIKEFGVDSIIHFAARKRVDESVARPAWYFQQNVGGLANLLLAAESTNVARFLFSSSAAVYSASESPVTEEDHVSPQNPYGETKLIGEWLAKDAALNGNLKAVSLRYFNVAGAGAPELADTGVLNLIPMVMNRLERGESPTIFGDDYPTPDGTCIRDFVHVQDVADAHIAALDNLDSLPDPHSVFNVGTGHGESVRSIIGRILRLADSRVKPVVLDRRPGDQAVVVASVEKIGQVLGWHARFGLQEIVNSAWEGWLHLHGRSVG